MTQRNFYENVIVANLSDEMTEFAQSMISKLDKKNETRRTTKSKAQIANDGIKVEILNSMNVNTIYTAGIIATDFEISTQKASALLKQLAENGTLEIIEGYKTSKGKVKGYKLIAEEADEAENEEVEIESEEVETETETESEETEREENGE